MKTVKHLALVLFAMLALGAQAEEGYYKDAALFSTRPKTTDSLTTIDRFGPVGISIDLVKPAFVMKVGGVEPGSPAEATGKFKKGQVIESINGQVLKDIDPRMQLGQLLAEAEATDGKLSFKIQGMAEPVVVQVPVLGSYSATWPLDCAKSEKIVRGLADYIASPSGNAGVSNIGMMFMLSTGDENDLAVVREWVHSLKDKQPSSYAWYLGFGGIPLAEYYLKTGDEVALPIIQAHVDAAVGGLYLGGWAGRGGTPAITYGNGHLNAAGTGALAFLLLAKECGADVPEHALLDALVHFYRYAGRGGNPYGDDRPEQGFVDNGKNGYLALAMAAAANLTPQGEDSLYANARDLLAYNGFYTTSFMLHGHTGGGIGEIWRSATIGLMRDKTPDQYRDFIDNRTWHYDLSRRYNGSFGILAGGGYDKEQWGVAFGLAYTVPRKQLRIFGAPPTKFSKPYQLPKQPWGNEADNDFLKFEPVPGKDGKPGIDLSGETLAKDSSMQFIRWFHDNDNPPTDEQIRQYIHHRDHVFRLIAANKALGAHHGYIGWRAAGGEVRPHLVTEFINHESPRVRRAIYSALATTIRKDGKAELMTRELFERVIASLQDADESWWVKDAALMVVAQAPADWIVPHTELLLTYLHANEWWLQNAAIQALAPIAADERAYKQVLPELGALLENNQRSALAKGLLPEIRASINAAGPQVQKLALETLRETYAGFEGYHAAEGGLDLANVRKSHLELLAESLASVPGGLDAVYELARERNPDAILPHRELFLNSDPAGYGPKLRKAIPPIVMNELIPEFVGKNKRRLEPLAAVDKQSTTPGADAIDELAELYRKAGNDAYGWQVVADWRNDAWAYHTFDPIKKEQVPWDVLITRYRPVTMPEGMDNWFANDFDAKAAGWKTAKSPFGNYNGKIPTGPIMKCSAACKNGPLCYAATPVNTLWDKEVLVMRSTFKVPPIKQGYRYRISVNDGNHVGPGGGYIIYVNGKPLAEKEHCNGRGSNGKPTGAFVTAEFLDDFKAGEVTLAVKTFIRYNDKYKTKPSSQTPQGKISLHMEAQLLPPMGDDLIQQSANVVPMLTSDWQAKYDPEDTEADSDASLFRWDGKPRPNPELLGTWKLVAEVADIAEFDPENLNKQRPRNPGYTQLTFKDAGQTDKPLYLWSGDTLMDLERYQALKLQPTTISGTDYLFIEAGGFSPRNKPDWKTRWLVLQR